MENKNELFDVVEQNDDYSISVLMSVYKNDTPENFKAAMDSILFQTYMPREIILVRDGLINEELEQCINSYLDNPLIKYIPLISNVGLGEALNIALNHSKYNLIARMDSDDISVKERFEIQIEALKTNDVDVIGGQIVEFNESIDYPISKREVSLKHSEIINDLKKRNPINHVTVLMKKNALIDAGGYIDFLYHEDYYLWIRMIKKGFIFNNVPDNLVYVRVDMNLFRRRGGFKYYKFAKKLQMNLLDLEIISRFEYLRNITIRFIVQVLMPTFLRGMFYRIATRRKYK